MTRFLRFVCAVPAFLLASEAPAMAQQAVRLDSSELSNGGSGAPHIAPGATSLDRALRLAVSTKCARGRAALQRLANESASREREVARRVLMACSAPEKTTSRADRSGRAVLVVGATTYGLWAGIAADLLFEVDSGRALVIPPLAGLGAGLGLSLAATSTGALSKGQAWATITGLDYGTYIGLLLALSLDFDDSREIVGTMLGSGIAGAVVAATSAQRWSPRHGTVEALRSGGLWGFSTAALLAGIVQPNEDTTVAGVMLIGMTGGLAIGQGLATEFPISRDRMLLGDAGALVGAVLGGGLYILAGGSPDSTTEGRILAGTTLTGLYAGLGTSLWLSRGWGNDTPEKEQEEASVPALLQRTQTGSWQAGPFSLVPTIETLGTQSALTGAWVPLVGGAW